MDGPNFHDCSAVLAKTEPKQRLFAGAQPAANLIFILTMGCVSLKSPWFQCWQLWGHTQQGQLIEQSGNHPYWGTETTVARSQVAVAR